jgi:hypothetical protein
VHDLNQIVSEMNSCADVQTLGRGGQHTADGAGPSSLGQPGLD